MNSLVYQAVKTSESKSTHVEDALVLEAPLQISINGEPYTVVMRTPGDDAELIRGLLYAEDIYKEDTPLELHKVKEEENGTSEINVRIAKERMGSGYMNQRTLLSVSSCGVCGKQKLEAVQLAGNALKNNNTYSLDDLKHMSMSMSQAQTLFKLTGGSHATAAFDAQGSLLSLKEDIGRHNALDKVIGALIKKGELEKASCILVSGRVSYEIVAKAFTAKIPIIVAVSACSSLAVDYAKEFGICLIGFNRSDKLTIYANPQYIAL